MYNYKKVIEEYTKIDSNIGVYAVICTVAKIIYIGQSTNIKSRFSSHKSSLKSKKHQNEGFNKAMWDVGIYNTEYVTLHNCPKHALTRVESHYISLFKSLGYVVFGDRDTSRRFNFLENEVGMNKNEQRYLEYLDKKYFIMIKEFKKDFYDCRNTQSSIVYNDYTDFLMRQMLNGIELYNEGDKNTNSIIDEFIKNDVSFIGSSFNYIAYVFFCEIVTNENWYKIKIEKEIKFKRIFAKNFLDQCSISRIIDTFKCDEEINNEMIKVFIIYSKNYKAFKEYNILEIVSFFTKRGKKGGSHFFDFLFYYIIIIYCECLISNYK